MSAPESIPEEERFRLAVALDPSAHGTGTRIRDDRGRVLDAVKSVTIRQTPEAAPTVLVEVYLFAVDLTLAPRE